MLSSKIDMQSRLPAGTLSEPVPTDVSNLLLVSSSHPTQLPPKELASTPLSLVAQERLLLERERAEEEQRLLQQRINEAAEEERRRAEMCATLRPCS